MGFLSKLFGGDGGTPPSKSEPPGSPGSAPEPDSAVAVREAPVEPPPPPPVRPAAPDPILEFSPFAEPPSSKPSAAAPLSTKAAVVAAPGSSKAGVQAPGLSKAGVPAPVPSKAAVGAPPSSRAVLAPPPAKVEVALPPIADKPPAAGAARPGAPERRRSLEDSVVTSAPKLPLDPSGGLGARPQAKPGKVTSPASPASSGRAATARTGAEKTEKLDKTEKFEKVDKPGSPSVEIAAAHPLRPRRDHNKSPGFYSSVSPAHGANAVTGSVYGPSLPKKATVVGLAPPPEAMRAPQPTRPDFGSPFVDGPPPASPEPVTVETKAVAPVAPTEPRPEMSVVPAAESNAPPQPCSAPPGSVAVARVEKEDTSPGLGYARSQHDPGMPPILPSADLELLLAFALDLALGCASPSWLGPLRASVSRLIMSAMGNNGLEKALITLAADLEQNNAFAEENRQRLYGHVVAVDLALAKRIDVTGQKAIRERLIVDQLLDEVAQAHPLLTRRLREQGLVSLDGLGRLSPADLSQKIEAPADAAVQVAGVFQGYLQQRAQRGPSVVLQGKAAALRERVSALVTSAEAFDVASEGEDSGDRRRTRKQRQTDVMQLNLLLAELGEARILTEIERCSVQAKIERVQRWIREHETSSVRVVASATPLA